MCDRANCLVYNVRKEWWESTSFAGCSSYWKSFLRISTILTLGFLFFCFLFFFFCRYSLSNIPLDHRKSKGIPEKHLLLLLTTLKPYTVWITLNCGKFLKRREYQKQQVKLDMEQWTASKVGKEYIKAVYCHLLI